MLWRTLFWSMVERYVGSFVSNYFNSSLDHLIAGNMWKQSLLYVSLFQININITKSHLDLSSSVGVMVLRVELVRINFGGGGSWFWEGKLCFKDRWLGSFFVCGWVGWYLLGCSFFMLEAPFWNFVKELFTNFYQFGEHLVSEASNFPCSTRWRVLPNGQVVTAEKASKGGLQEKLTMTVAVPLLWGVPPASETLHLAVRSGGGIVDKVFWQWDFL